MNNELTIAKVQSTQITKLDAQSQFDSLVKELSSLSQKASDIQHDKSCGIEEHVLVGEGVDVGPEFVCNCDYDIIWNEVQTILQETSEFADTHKIYNTDSLKIHERAGHINRRYIAAQSLGLVELQLDLLGDMKRFEEGAELAIQHRKTKTAISLLERSGNLPRLLQYAQEQNLEKVVVKTLLKMDDIDGALRHAESKAMHNDSLEILCSKMRTDEAVRYAQRYNLHDKAVEILGNQNAFEALFEYGEKNDCFDLVKNKSQNRLEHLLNEDNSSSAASSKAQELCMTMERYQLSRSAGLYREVIDEFERRVEAKKRVNFYEELFKKEKDIDRGWFDVADLELSLGHVTRYKKIWTKTKEMWENIPHNTDDWDTVIDGSMLARSGYTTKRTNHVSLAQSMIDNPRYYSPDTRLPKLGVSTNNLLSIAMPLANLLELENKDGEKKYPTISLNSVLAAWGKNGIDLFFERNGIDGYNKKNHYTYASEFIKKELSVYLQNVNYPIAFTFIIHYYPFLFKINETEIRPLNEPVKESKFYRLGELLEYALDETAQDKEKSTRRKIALENLIYVPVKKLSKENIFDLATGGPDAVWKHITSNENNSNSSFIDSRLHEIRQAYTQFDEETKIRMKDIFFEAYVSSEMTKTLERALTLYIEIKQAYGKPIIFNADHPFYFLNDLPSDKAKMQSHTKQVMKEIYSTPSRRKQLAEVALGRELPEFFERAFELNNRRDNEFIEKLTKFLDASSQQLEVYSQALKSTTDAPITFFELDATPKGEHEALPKWTFFEHYDHFASAIIANKSSLFVPGSIAQHVITTSRPQGKKYGIKERMLREVDAIGYLFREMYQIAQSQTFKEEADFRQNAVASAVKLWRRKQEEFLPSEVAETLIRFNFNRFFHGNDKEVQSYLENTKKRNNNDSMFIEQPEIIFSRILDPGYYLSQKSDNDQPRSPDDMSKPSDKKPKTLSDEFINAVNRLKNGLSTSWEFDELRCEFNEILGRNFFNNAAECTGNRGKYQRYGYAHMQDHNIGIIAANLYKSGKYKSTVGKAFLARCNDENKKELLYVDGVVILQDIADFLEEPNSEEAHWAALYTKAILQTALTHNLEEVVFNVSHQLAQRSVWQYIRHVAELLELENGKDYTYKEGYVDDGSKVNKVKVKTMSNDGFELNKIVAENNCHYLEKKKDSSYDDEHLLEGFWINHFDPVQAKNSAPLITAVVKPLDHREIPYINDGKGYVIGLRRNREELITRFNHKYGELYGKI